MKTEFSILFILYLMVVNVCGQTYPRPSPIPSLVSSSQEYNETKLTPSVRLSLPVIEDSFLSQNKPKIKSQENILNNYKPKILLHHFFI